MKKTLICSYFEFVHIDDIASDDNNIIDLKDGKSWTRIPKSISLVYNSANTPNDSGVLCKETLTVSAYSEDVALLASPKQYYVLRLFTNSENFLIGSKTYPARKQFSDDKKIATINFECTSAL